MGIIKSFLFAGTILKNSPSGYFLEKTFMSKLSFSSARTIFVWYKAKSHIMNRIIPVLATVYVN